jgi:hypothetical protein
MRVSFQISFQVCQMSHLFGDDGLFRRSLTPLYDMVSYKISKPEPTQLIQTKIIDI